MSLFGQIQHNINKTSGTISNSINTIDSISFNAAQTEMQIRLNNGNVETHTLSDINNVTFSGQAAGSISGLDCANATVSGVLIGGSASNNVTAVLNYIGGNGGTHAGQVVTSTGVTGLSANLTAGTFMNGAGTLTYLILGTPATAGTANFALDIGGQNCTLQITVESGAIASIDCANATINGVLTDGVVANNVSVNIGYTGGNGSSHIGQTVNSTGVLGLTATLNPGNFTNGSGVLNYIISGTPSAAGTAVFIINIGGQTCTLEVPVVAPVPFNCGTDNVTFTYKGFSQTYGTVAGANGRCWLDRNLGAIQVATSSTDQFAYGDLFQWGRADDGHQDRQSSFTTVLAQSDQPGHGDFIQNTSTANFRDWTFDNNDERWAATPMVNNPCPEGWKVPTVAEFDIERSSWSTNDAVGAFSSPLKLTRAGRRSWNTGTLLSTVGEWGWYWTIDLGTTTPQHSRRFQFGATGSTSFGDGERGYGYSVRCIKE